MKRFRSTPLLAGIWVVALAVGGAWAAPLPDETAPKAQTARGEDCLWLADGGVVTGRILNDSFRLRTSYGVLELKTRVFTSFDFTRAPHGLVCAVTINSNQFTGFLEDASFRVESTNGQPQEIRRERVSRVVIGSADRAEPALKQGQWIRLKTGDTFSGQPAEPSAARREENLTFTLDLGPVIALYRDSIDCMDGKRMGTETAASALPQAGVGSANIPGMIWIVPGEFLMGSTSDEPGRDPDEGPQTRMRIAQGFWMGKCEVTQAEYQRVIGLNPSHTTGDPARPVERVNWFEAVAYCAKLNELSQEDRTLPKGYAYRLPTEAEWEYACRAGSNTRFCYGDDRSDVNLGDYAWFARNSESTTHPTGTKQPNAWGLCDMHGNVWEWCLDRWEGALPGGVQTNTPAPARGGLRTARGGSWLYEAKSCRCANRDDYSPFNRCSDVGFRVVLAPVVP